MVVVTSRMAFSRQKNEDKLNHVSGSSDKRDMSRPLNGIMGLKTTGEK